MRPPPRGNSLGIGGDTPETQKKSPGQKATMGWSLEVAWLA